MLPLSPPSFNWMATFILLNMALNLVWIYRTAETSTFFKKAPRWRGPDEEESTVRLFGSSVSIRMTKNLFTMNDVVSCEKIKFNLARNHIVHRKQKICWIRCEREAEIYHWILVFCTSTKLSDQRGNVMCLVFVEWMTLATIVVRTKEPGVGI